MFIALMVAMLLGQASDKKPVETAHLSIVPSTSAASVARGGKVTLLLDVTPKPKMHVYAPGQEGYIAITVTLDANQGVTAGKAKYPAGEKYVMPALNETQMVYAKPFRISDDVTVTAGAGDKIIKGTVRYQACDDAICYIPKTVPVEWTVTVR